MRPIRTLVNSQSCAAAGRAARQESPIVPPGFAGRKLLAASRELSALIGLGGPCLTARPRPYNVDL